MIMDNTHSPKFFQSMKKAFLIITLGSCKTLKGSTSYHSFRIKNSETVYHRTLTCHCNNCINMKWEDCKCDKICGDWARYDWKYINNTNNNSNTTMRRRKRKRNDNNDNPKPKRQRYSYQYESHNDVPNLDNVQMSSDNAQM